MIISCDVSEFVFDVCYFFHKDPLHFMFKIKFGSYIFLSIIYALCVALVTFFLYF